MEEKIVEEHRALNSLFDKARTLLSDKASASASDGNKAFEELREALEVHMSAEEDLYFPTIWALRPEHEARLRTFIQAHARFRAILEDVAGLMGGGKTAQATATLEKLDEYFEGHEGQEERLLRAIDQ